MQNPTIYDGVERSFLSRTITNEDIAVVILSIMHHSGSLGAAVYSLNDKTLRIVYDVQEASDDYNLVKSIIYQYKPTSIIVSSRQDIGLLQFLKKFCIWESKENVFKSDKKADVEMTNNDDSFFEPSQPRECRSNSKTNRDQDNDPTRLSSYIDDNDEEERADDKPFLIILSSNIFNYENCCARLQQLFAEENDSEPMAKLSVSFQLDLNSQSMVRATGALLRHLEAQRVGVELEDFSHKTPIKRILTSTIDQMLDVDENTVKALQIFQRVIHPAKHRLNAFKEGRSVFAICNRCISRPGKKELLRWFQRPTLNRETLLSRQEAIELFRNAENSAFITTIKYSLKNISSMSCALRRIVTSKASIYDWQKLKDTVYYCTVIASLLGQSTLECAFFKQQKQKYTKRLLNIGEIVESVVDFAAMAEENRFVVKQGNSASLDERKQLYNELPSLLTQVARHEYERLRDYATHCSVSYMPMFGYLLCIDRNDSRLNSFCLSVRNCPTCASGKLDATHNHTSRNNNQENTGTTIQTSASNYTLDVDDSILATVPDVDFVFSSDSAVYYKNDRMRRLDSSLGDLKFQIYDLEASVMIRLQQSISYCSGDILNAVNAAAQIDCAISLASAASEYGWTKPVLSTQSQLELHGAKHPIVELTCKNAFVANDCTSDESNGKIQIISGPNASGKSVYLKQIGVIAYLAHIGSFVPCERGVIGPINRIFSRIHTIDSVLDGMSTFAVDLQQVGSALRRADANSLVIIDEFGKGTLKEVGVGLLSATLRYWIRASRNCPHVLVASHFHVLQDILSDVKDKITWKTMQISLSDEELHYDFKLVPGVIDNSYAAEAAKRAGLPQHIIDRGYEIYQQLRRGELIQLPPTSVVDELTEEQKRKDELYREQMLSIFKNFVLNVRKAPDKNSKFELCQKMMKSEKQLMETRKKLIDLSKQLNQSTTCSSDSCRSLMRTPVKPLVSAQRVVQKNVKTRLYRKRNELTEHNPVSSFGHSMLSIGTSQQKVIEEMTPLKSIERVQRVQSRSNADINDENKLTPAMPQKSTLATLSAQRSTTKTVTFGSATIINMQNQHLFATPLRFTVPRASLSDVTKNFAIRSTPDSVLRNISNVANWSFEQNQAKRLRNDKSANEE